TLDHLPFSLKTPQPSGSFPTKKGLPRRVTAHRACGGSLAREAWRDVSSVTNFLVGGPDGRGDKARLASCGRPSGGGGPVTAAAAPSRRETDVHRDRVEVRGEEVRFKIVRNWLAPQRGGERDR